LLVAATRTVVLVGYDLPSVLWVLRAAAAVEPGRARDAPRPVWDLRAVRTLALLALPLGLSTFLYALNVNIPRYFIKDTLGKTELGVYAAMMYIMQVGGMCIASMSYSVSPRLARVYAAGNLRGYCLLLLKMVAIGVALGAAAVATVLLFGRELLLILYTAEFAEYADVFVWAAIACGIGYVADFLGVGMIAARYFAIQMPLECLVLSATTAGCFLFMPAHGLAGAVGAIVLSSAVQAAGGLAVCVYAVVRGRRKEVLAPAAEAAEAARQAWATAEVVGQGGL
jgi:O-antigen/teichoic acid export membrane protein